MFDILQQILHQTYDLVHDDDVGLFVRRLRFRFQQKCCLFVRTELKLCALMQSAGWLLYSTPELSMYHRGCEQNRLALGYPSGSWFALLFSIWL